MKIDLTHATSNLIEYLARLDFIELHGTKPTMLKCPACGRKNAKHAVEQHNDGCLIEVAQAELERRFLNQ